MPLMMIENRNYTLVSTLGHVVRFSKGTPIGVPPALVSAARAVGAVIVDGTVPAEDKEKMENPIPQDLDERNARLMKAMKLMSTRTERSDFTAGGLPSIKALSNLVGFEPTAQERDAAWDKVTHPEEA